MPEEEIQAKREEKLELVKYRDGIERSETPKSVKHEEDNNFTSNREYSTQPGRNLESKTAFATARESKATEDDN